MRLEKSQLSKLVKTESGFINMSDEAKYLVREAELAKERVLRYAESQLVHMSDEMLTDEDKQVCLNTIRIALESFPKVNMCGNMIKAGKMPISWDFEPEFDNVGRGK